MGDVEADLFGGLGVGGLLGAAVLVYGAGDRGESGRRGARSNTRSLLAEEISTPMLV
ncbi:hypothetical protein ACGFYP_05390 [Streptomyces sp. NPDC048370]|uniref:hypothetical protein n=1 Tax=Streptomyces sp. NPDC048370 TaxID=3365540 RepID=UPI0037133CB5